MVKVYKCLESGVVVAKLDGPEDHTPSCCGKPMVELKANTTDAATEKHVPVIEKDGSKVVIKVGSVAHPMTEEHYIGFVALETSNGLRLQELNHTGEPEATFFLGEGEELKAAYEYCNLHGLWKAEA
ncbi:desulfoferrodoxin family protein [Eubacteriales bacterium KG127]